MGLGIHPDKTKILSDQEKEEITVGNIKIEVLSKGDSARYLGQKITFEEQETEEIKNRLKAAWAAFHKYRQELTSKDYRLCHRLRLFNMVITPTLTYASRTWTLSQKHERMIRTAQRKMLRHIVQTKRNTNQETKKKQRMKQRRRRKSTKKKKKKSARLTKKLKRAQIRTLIKIKTAMCPSKKTLKKQSTLLKKKKIGLNTSREVPEKL